MVRYVYFFVFFAILALESSGQERPNVVFIAVDDLRPELGCYGNDVVISPNLDQLASQGTVFREHFVTVPTCGASRYSLLTGRLPRVRQELSNAIFETRSGQHANEAAAPESFVEHLRRNGYYTVGIGKISHSADGRIYGYTEPVGDELELPSSWDEMLFDAGQWETGWNAFFAYADGSNRNGRDSKVKPYESGQVDDRGYPDGLTADLAVKKLGELAGKEKPFFLGVGFFKPHLPFNAPEKYWNLYDRETIPLTPSPGIPENVHPSSLHESGEFNRYSLGEERASLERPVSDAYARKLKHAYFASVSYVDAQIGKVLDRLRELGLEENTIVIVWGDHGWHLGDDRVWGKHTIFDWSLRSPLIIRTPDGKKGAYANHVVGSVDIYPTLMELCGINTPQGTDGASFARLLKRPGSKRWKNVAYSYYRNGITVRTPRYRLTRYFRKEQPVIELYDHRNDPFEKKNVAEMHPEVVRKLMPLLEDGNTGLYGSSD